MKPLVASKKAVLPNRLVRHRPFKGELKKSRIHLMHPSAWFDGSFNATMAVSSITVLVGVDSADLSRQGRLRMMLR